MHVISHIQNFQNNFHFHCISFLTIRHKLYGTISIQKYQQNNMAGQHSKFAINKFFEILYK